MASTKFALVEPNLRLMLVARKDPSASAANPGTVIIAFPQSTRAVWANCTPIPPGSVVAIMKLSADWYDFKAKLDKIHPPHGRETQLSFEYADEEKEDTGKGL
jgi:hypothetical protein